MPAAVRYAESTFEEKIMTHWWEIPITDGTPARPRAVAYYRHLAQDRQENSIIR